MPPQRNARGMVTAELAVATLAALSVLLMLSWGIFVIVMQMRCIDTAAEVARQSARGDSAAVGRARANAPAGAQIRVRSTTATVRVEVRLSARPFAQWLVAVPLLATAEIAPEPGVGGGG